MKHERQYRDMNIEEFRRCIDQVQPYTDYVYFHVQGEPLLHPDIDSFFDYTDEKKCHVQLVTNASLLASHKHLYRHPSLRKISFSLQSIEYQHCKDPIAYLETILEFCDHATERGIYCEVRFWRDDQADMPATTMCMNYLKEKFHMEETERRNSLKLQYRLYLSYGNSFSWPDIRDNEYSDIGTCRATDQIAILSDGTVVPCCLDCKGVIALGNVSTQNLSDILSSTRYTTMVNGFRNHRIIEPLCKKCTYRHRFD